MPSANQPPLRTIDELIRDRASRFPDTNILAYPTRGTTYEEFTYRDLDLFAYVAAQEYAKYVPIRASSSLPNDVVALLGPSDLNYFIATLALTKLGHSVLFLSTRISEAAYVSLIAETEAKAIIYDPSFKDMAEKVRASSKADIISVEIFTEEVYRNSARLNDLSLVCDTRLDSQLDHNVEKDRIAWIIHSSGSTGLPKSIRQTHLAALLNYANNVNMKGFITLPLFHAHGISSVFRAIDSGKEIHMYSASLPLTSSNIIDVMTKNKFEIFYGVPYALKLLAETEEGLRILRELKLVMFGGSSCPDVLGDKLVQNGVYLVSHYGTTETGQLMTSIRDRENDPYWNYLRPPPKLQPFVRFEKQGDTEVYELVVLDGWPSKVASNRPDKSYATKDLFIPHPTIPGLWKYFARLDDTIVLVNGEKANPIQFEHTIRQDKHVAEAIVVGAGRPQLGLFVVPSSLTIGMSTQQILDAITPALEIANSNQESYARIVPEMVRILPHDTVYPRTDKGTIIRAAFNKQLSDMIEDLYQSAETRAGADGLALSQLELHDWLHKLVSSVMGLNDDTILKTDTDFFSIGMDSLHAIRIRASILKNLNTGTSDLGLNIVFEYPTIRSLASKLYTMRVSDGESEDASSTLDQMQELLQKYSVFSKHTPGSSTISGEYIVLTGTTGSLGAHILSTLIQMGKIQKVYALVRANSVEDAQARIASSLLSRKLYESLPAGAREKIVPVPCDLTRQDLGMSPDLYTEVISSVTRVIHTAWAVNFNMNIRSFEPSIQGLHNLIQLCLSSSRPAPASFQFISSVSAVAFTPSRYAEEAVDHDFTHAQDMGYAQSKMVSENICFAAAENYGVVARVLRVGQICGDTINGVWNATEAIPLMLQAAVTIGAIPALDENDLWLPVDTVASTVVDLSFISPEAAPRSALFHVVNPKSFHWTRDLIPYMKAAGLKFEVLPQRDWIARLRQSNPDPVKNPPIKLLEFFSSKYDKESTSSSAGMQYSTKKAVAFSKSLAEAPLLDTGLLSKYIAYWRETAWK